MNFRPFTGTTKAELLLSEQEDTKNNVRLPLKIEDLSEELKDFYCKITAYWHEDDLEGIESSESRAAKFATATVHDIEAFNATLPAASQESWKETTLTFIGVS